MVDVRLFGVLGGGNGTYYVVGNWRDAGWFAAVICWCFGLTSFVEVVVVVVDVLVVVGVVAAVEAVLCRRRL